MEQSLAAWNRDEIVATLKTLVAEFTPQAEDFPSRCIANASQ